MTKAGKARNHPLWDKYVATLTHTVEHQELGRKIMADLPGVTIATLLDAARYKTGARGRPRRLARCPHCDQPMEGARAARNNAAASR